MFRRRLAPILNSKYDTITYQRKAGEMQPNEGYCAAAVVVVCMIAQNTAE